MTLHYSRLKVKFVYNWLTIEHMTLQKIMLERFSGLAKLRDQLLYAKMIFVKMVVVSKGKCVCEEMFIVDERLFYISIKI